MSKFKTVIPVDVRGTTDALPRRTFINNIRFDGEAVVIEWENDDFKTPYTFPVEWPDPHEVPAGVQQLSGQPGGSPSPKPTARAEAAPVKNKRRS